MTRITSEALNNRLTKLNANDLVVIKVKSNWCLVDYSKPCTSLEKDYTLLYACKTLQPLSDYIDNYGYLAGEACPVEFPEYIETETEENPEPSAYELVVSFLAKVVNARKGNPVFYWDEITCASCLDSLGWADISSQLSKAVKAGLVVELPDGFSWKVVDPQETPELSIEAATATVNASIDSKVIEAVKAAMKTSKGFTVDTSKIKASPSLKAVSPSDFRAAVNSLVSAGSLRKVGKGLALAS